MERHQNKTTGRKNLFAESFESNKLKALIKGADSNKSFSERFSNWISQYAIESKEKIWFDVESYRSR